jgi:hypothetical protein
MYNVYNKLYEFGRRCLRDTSAAAAAACPRQIVGVKPALHDYSTGVDVIMEEVRRLLPLAVLAVLVPPRLHPLVVLVLATPLRLLPLPLPLPLAVLVPFRLQLAKKPPVFFMH